MVENPGETPRKSPSRLLTGLIRGLARLTLLAAAACLLIALVLLVGWWRLLSWPQRHKTPRDRTVAQREALLELVQAAGTLLALRKAA